MKERERNKITLNWLEWKLKWKRAEEKWKKRVGIKNRAESDAENEDKDEEDE